MTKHIRDLIDDAERLGLTYVGTQQAKRHVELIFENSLGKRCVMRVHQGSKDGLATTSTLNKIATLKRFARGEYHNVHLI